ncbi:BST1 [Sanghuangporus weigelae]
MLRVVFLAGAAFVLILLLAYSAFDTPAKISPQGCRMSYMSPSYVLLTGFNASWTSPSLASRYRLMLYREVGWDPQNELRGMPVLFIPGNAGSAHQVRSIASSASRQYYSSPSHINPEFSSRNLKSLDVFAVDFNEDLSAFHGPTLASQRQYSADAISYILSLYPPDTKIIILGHSMGGIVATALLPASQIATIITMSTPHGVPPARFDSRMDAIYADVQMRLAYDPTPILSVCGGITDTMIPSEFCTLLSDAGDTTGYRETVFTSSLDGCWSGVGHREMVWCHQVRWRVARAVLELGGSRTSHDIGQILDYWFRDGIGPSKPELGDADTTALTIKDPISVSEEAFPLIIKNPRGFNSFRLKIPYDDHNDRIRNLVVYLSQGTILSVSPADPLPLKMSVHSCRNEVVQDTVDDPIPICELIEPSSLRLIPNPDSEKPFPVPREGVDESDGVVVFMAQLPPRHNEFPGEWIQIEVQSDTNKGWAVVTIENEHSLANYANSFAPLFRVIDVHLDPISLRTEISFPSLLSDVLIVYRARAKLSGSCKDSLLPPLLLHTSGPHEAHFHRLLEGQPFLLHDHSSAPFLPLSNELRKLYSRGLNLTVYSSGECGVETLTITIDWWNSFGRWGGRYWNAILTWSAGVVCYLSYASWSVWDAGAPMPSPFQSFGSLVRLLPRAMVLFTVVSIIPLPSAFWLGNVGEPMFVLLASLLLLISCGLVILSWIVLLIFLLPYGKLISRFSRTTDEDSREQASSLRTGLATVSIMSLLVFLFIPWQVAFLACYLIHLHHSAILLQSSPGDQAVSNVRNQKLLVLLAMTWCLPVVAPVLAVWVRTLATAGLSTPFDGDHFVFNSLSFVALTYAMATSRDPLFQRRHRWEAIPIPYLYALGAFVAFLVGPRSTYRMYEALNWPTLALLCFRVAPRYFHGTKTTNTASVADVREI